MDFLSTLPNIDPQMITTIGNLVFIGLVFLVLLGGLIGLLRGVWNASFRLIFIGILVILSYALASRIGDWVSGINITKIVGASTITANGITVNITTLKDTLIEYIGAMATETGGSLQKTLNDPRTLSLITELALMVIRLGCFLVLAILIIILGNLLATLLYHVIFKHLIAKKVRKEIKLRLVAFGEGMLKSALVLSMLVVPFSSILNSISKAFKNGDAVYQKELSGETYNQLMEWIDAYNNSAFAKVLFSWTRDSDNNTLDMKLADIITSSRGENSMAFTNELSSLLSIGTTLLASGAADINENGDLIINGSILLDSEIVTVLISQLTTSSLVLNILPIAADFALNMDEVGSFIDNEKVDLSEIDWGNELTTLSSIYSDMYESGIVDEEVIMNPSLMLKRVLNVKDESVHTQLMKTFEKFDEMELLNQILPSLLWTLANAKDDLDQYIYPLHDYLPTDWEKYQGIKFGYEFATIYDSVYRINKVTDNAIVEFADKALVANEGNKEKSKMIKYENSIEDEHPEGDSHENEDLNKMINAILTNIPEIVPIFVGERDGAGDFTNLDSKGKTINGRCLLDSDLIYNSLDKLSGVIITSLCNAMWISIDSSKVIDAVSELNTRLDFKKEYSVMLDIVANISSDEDTKDILQMGKIDLNENVCKSLKKSLSRIDESKILTATIPQILESIIKSSSDSLEKIGISADSINYKVKSLSKEIGLVLDLAPAVSNIIDALSDESKSLNDKISQVNSSDLTTILKCIKESDIFNHKDENSNKKENFFIIVDKLFEMAGYEGSIIDKIESDDREYFSKINWDNEIDNIGNFYDAFKDSELTKFLENTSGYLDADVFDPDSIVPLFDAIDESKLLKTGLGAILDKNLSGFLNSLEGANLSFTNIEDWHSEGLNFAKLMHNAQKLSEDKENLNIDFINSDATDDEGNLLIRNLAVALSESQLFEDEYGFGNFLKEQLVKSGASLKFNDIDNPDECSKTTQFFNEVSARRDWDKELDIIFDFIRALQNIGKDSGAEGQFGSAGLDIVLESPYDYTDLFVSTGGDHYGITNFEGINSSNALRMVIANAIKDAADEINEVGGRDLKVQTRLNVQALVDMDNVADRNEELQTVCDALDRILEIDDFEKVRKDESGTELDNLKGAITSLHNSKMFNTLNNEGKENEADATVFEGIIAEFINATIGEDAILGKLNDEMTLKYNYSLELILGDEKLSNNRCDINKDDKWIDKDNELGEISKLINVIKLAKDIDFDDVGNDDGWLENHCNELLPELNDSNLLYRTIPYFINEFIKTTDTSDISSDFDLNAAKPAYSYNEYTHEYDKYDESEISKLITILDNFTVLEEVMEDDFAINKIREDNKEDNIRDTLKALADSHVFHLEGSNLVDKDTVFIQIMCISFNESTLSETIYDVDLYQEFYDEMNITDEEANARFKILNFDAKTKLGNKTWSEEIDDIFVIYDYVIDLNDDEIVFIRDVNVKKMTPEQITDTLKATNSSDLCYDAVPIFIKKTFNNVSLSNFSKFNNQNKENYLIGRENYDSELDTIYELLIGIAKHDDSSEDGYVRDENGNIKYAIKFNDSFKISEFVDNGNSFSLFVQFLVDSKIFRDCRGLVLKNAIKSVGFADYISTRYDGQYEIDGELLEHSNVFDLIFDKIEEENLMDKQIKVEGASLDLIAKSLETIIKDSKNGSDTFTALDSSAIKSVYKNCYIYKCGELDQEYIKSYLACEIVSGFLSSSIRDSNYLDDYYCDGGELGNKYMSLWYFDGENDFAYTLFNDLEADALSSSIDSVNLLSEIGNDISKINSSIVERISTLLNSLYYESNDGSEYKDSIIASLVYKKGIYNKLMGEDGICYKVNAQKDMLFINNATEKTQFTMAYNDMLINCNDSIKGENFKFKNVQIDITDMFNAIAALA